MILFPKETFSPLRVIIGAVLLLVLWALPVAAIEEIVPYDFPGQRLAAQSVDYTAETLGLVSHVGDSFADNLDHRAFMAQRLANPSAFGSPIPGNLSYKVHAYGGHTAGDILVFTTEGGWGRGEGADIVMLMAGTNDVILGTNQNQEIESQVWDMFLQMQALVDKVKADSDVDRPRIVVSGIPPFDNSPMSHRAQLYNETLRDNLKGCDVFSDANFFDFYDHAAGHADLSYMADYAHLNTEGYRMMSDNWLEAIGALYDENIIQNNPHIYMNADYLGAPGSNGGFDPDSWVEPYEIPSDARDYLLDQDAAI